MKKLWLVVVSQIFMCSAFAQDLYKITYQHFRDSILTNQEPIVVIADRNRAVITRQSILDATAPFSYEELIIDKPTKSIKRRATLSATQKVAVQDSKAWTKYNFDLKSDQKNILHLKTTKATTSINSNAIEVWYTQELPIIGAPNDLGINLGLVLEYRRNGNSGLIATKIEPLKAWPKGLSLADDDLIVDKLTYDDRLWKSRFIHIPIFTNEQISFQPGISSDSIMRFAAGTVILKKVKIPEVLPTSQAFIELVEKSNGDAYDRTGSVFLIADDQPLTFLDGMLHGMDKLPKYDVGDGKDYVGFTRTADFSPVYELMRFFTPFGVNHFNDRLTLKGKTWQDSVSYRQDISEFVNTMAGKDVYIGVYIGNYDKGGHKISLDLTIHSGLSNYANNTSVLSLFNTTNVMEMGGQTYSTLFGSPQGLEIEFELPKDVKNARLRYITTGHGGWGEGDEFVPKENTLFLDDQLLFKFTPWRVDCGSYRLYNPVSGNFNNGLSSSDLSRSNWCPGTITLPNYISIGELKAGKHKIKVSIPQGSPAGESLSFWNVSGALIYNTND